MCLSIIPIISFKSFEFHRNPYQNPISYVKTSDSSPVFKVFHVLGLETHGTGTALGDPMEVGALQTALGSSGRSRPLQLGAAKSNVGHLEGGAGGWVGWGWEG